MSSKYSSRHEITHNIDFEPYAFPANVELKMLVADGLNLEKKSIVHNAISLYRLIPTLEAA